MDKDLGAKVLEVERKGNGTGEEPTIRPLAVVNVAELIKMNLPPRENILAPVFQTQSINMMPGPRGIGKTLFVQGIAYAVASGGCFLDRWEALRPRRVLYIDGEMPLVVNQERFARIITSADKEPLPDNLRIITPDVQPWGMPDLSTKLGQAAVEPHLDGVELVVIDNISCLCRTGRENEAESWLPVQEWALYLRSKGISTLFVHHTGKTGQQRGTSKREDVLDTILALRRPADYHPSEGARFEVHFEKARGIYGDDVRPFELKLVTNGSHQEWQTKDLEESKVTLVAEYLKDGLSGKEIAELLGVSKGQVSKLKARAVSEGFLR